MSNAAVPVNALATSTRIVSSALSLRQMFLNQTAVLCHKARARQADA